MLKIRLARGGAKKRPYYYIVVADSHAPRDGKFIERVGSYNPLVAKDSPERIKLKLERIAEWMAKGAQPTDRVARFLSQAGVGEWKHGENPNKGKPGKKSEERAAERSKRDADLEEAKATAAAAPPPPPEPEPAPEPAPEPEAAAPEPVAEEAAAAEAAPEPEAPAEAEAPAKADEPEA